MISGTSSSGVITVENWRGSRAGEEELANIVSFAAVVRVVTKRFSPTKRCVTTVIAAAQ